MQTFTITLYQFDELTDSAKEKAREWYREGMEFCSFYGADVVSECVEIAALFGLYIEPKSVYYAVGGYCNDGACFTGTYRYAQQSVKRITSEYCAEYIDGKSSWVYEPIQIARDLQSVQRKYFYRLYASTSGNGRYHSQRTSVDIDDYNRELLTEDAETVEQCITDYASWIHTRLNEEYEYQNSDEQVDESIRINEYTFTAEGEREG